MIGGYVDVGGKPVVDRSPDQEATDREWKMGAEEYLRALREGNAPFNERAEMLLRGKLQLIIGAEALMGPSERRCTQGLYRTLMDAYGFKGVLLRVEYSIADGLIVWLLSMGEDGAIKGQHLELDPVLARAISQRSVKVYPSLREAFGPGNDSLVRSLFMLDNEPLDGKEMVVIPLVGEGQSVGWIGIGITPHERCVIGVPILITRVVACYADRFFGEELRSEHTLHGLGQAIQCQAKNFNEAHRRAREDMDAAVERIQNLMNESLQSRADLLGMRQSAAQALEALLESIDSSIQTFLGQLPKKGPGSQRLPRAFEVWVRDVVKMPLVNLLDRFPVKEASKRS